MVATVACSQLTPVKKVASSFKQLCSRLSLNNKRTITISHPVLISQSSTEVAVKIHQLESLIVEVTRLIQLPRAPLKPLNSVVQSSAVTEHVVPAVPAVAVISACKPRKHLRKNIDSIAAIAAFLTSHPITFNPSFERSTASTAQLGSRGTPNYLTKGLSLMERLREQRNRKLKAEEEAEATKVTIAEHVEIEVVEAAEGQREAAAEKAEEEEEPKDTDDDEALISDDDSDSSASSSEPSSPPPSPLFDSSRKLFGDCLPPSPPRKASPYERRTRTNARSALNSTILTLRAECPRRHVQPTTIAEDEDEEEEDEQHVKADSRFVKLSPHCRPRPVFRRAPPSLEKEESRGMQLMRDMRARLVEQQREQDELGQEEARSGERPSSSLGFYEDDE